VGRGSLALAAALLLLTAFATPAAEIRLRRGPDPSSAAVDSLRRAEGVANPVLACLASLVDEDLYGWVGQARLRRAVEEGGDARIPWRDFLWVRRQARPPGAPLLTVRFLDRLHVPLPYALLGYHPGSLRATPRVEVVQWRQGPYAVAWTDEEGRAQALRVEDLELFGLREGEVVVDVDGWLDALMGGGLDDIRITGLALFRHEGRRLGLAFGYSPEGEGRTGVLDLGADKLLFPVPRPYLALGRSLRARSEALLRGEAGASAPASP